MLTLILISLFYKKKQEQGAENVFLLYGEERNNRKDRMFLQVYI
jgi:hypothetical protein